jgi:hypothetical protein
MKLLFAVENAQLSVNKQNVTFDEAKTYLKTLNLGYLIDMMCREDYPLPRWIKPEAENACLLYKNFLLLQKKHPDINLVPSRIMDEVWHNHILHTQQYSTDCQAIFGHYLHHLPANPKENPEQLVDDYQQTKQLYFDLFGENF